MIVRFREDDRNDRHCRVTVFSSETATDEQSPLGNSGELVLDTKLWDALLAGLTTRVAMIGGVTIFPPVAGRPKLPLPVALAPRVER